MFLCFCLFFYFVGAGSDAVGRGVVVDEFWSSALGEEDRSHLVDLLEDRVFCLVELNHFVWEVFFVLWILGLRLDLFLCLSDHLLDKRFRTFALEY